MIDNYNFTIDDFTGPLDVLLMLVKEQKKDILEIDMLKLAHQYLEFIKNIKNNQINLSSSYLLMASYLLELKSKAILPLENANVDEDFFESEKQKLIAKLIAYKKYKEQIPFFEDRLKSRLKYFTKPISNPDQFAKASKAISWPQNLNNLSLARAVAKMFEKQNEGIIKEVSYVNKDIDPKGIENIILSTLEVKDDFTFEEIYCQGKSLQYLLVSFICLLDLAKSEIVNLVQLEKFDKIYVKKRIK